jgi:hypothetical protein
MGNRIQNPEDEPVFVLRGQDQLAASIVREWARRFRDKHVRMGTQGQDLANAILKFEGAQDIADQMDGWRTKKFPD